MKADVAIPLRLVLLWVSIWEPLVPACRRATWRDQGELISGLLAMASHGERPPPLTPPFFLSSGHSMPAAPLLSEPEGPVRCCSTISSSRGE